MQMEREVEKIKTFELKSDHNRSFRVRSIFNANGGSLLDVIYHSIPPFAYLRLIMMFFSQNSTPDLNLSRLLFVVLFFLISCGGSSNKTVAPTNNIQVSVTIQGQGSVSGDGFNCSNVCTQTIASGTQVNLIATAGTGEEFSNWGGACSGSSTTCAFIVNSSNNSVSATFETPTPTVEITIQTTNNGTISGSGFDCGTTCVQTIDIGTSISLSATQAAGYLFDSWGGACSGTELTCNFTATADTTLVSAAFIDASGGNQVYYVDVNAADDNGNGSIHQPKKHIQSAIDLMSNIGGNTVIIKPGTYSNTLDAIIDPPSGRSDNYNTIKAEVDGTVIIEGVRDHPTLSHYSNLNLFIDGESGFGVDPQYLIFEGLHFKNRSAIKGIGGDYIKFFRTGFEQGPDGNNYVLAVGGSYLLFEDCFYYGEGGRQAVAVYEGDHIIFRRGVIRHDLGWNPDGKMEPQGVATIYNSNHVEFQNILLLDSHSDPVHGEWYGALTFATNGPATVNNALRGLITMNVEGTTHAFGGYSNITGVLIEDEIAFSDHSVGYFGDSFITMNNGTDNNKDVTINRATIVNYYTMIALYGSPEFSAQVDNSIIQNADNIFIDGHNQVTSSYNNCSPDNYGHCDDFGSTTYDPSTNGLMYLPRIENNSTLATAGENGGRVGATVTNKIGVSGTLYGEAGFNTVTDELLWPWPYEDRIKQKMCFDMGVTRGFCSTDTGLHGGNITLTSYIWEALGNACPNDICT